MVGQKKIPNIPRKEEEVEEFTQTFIKCLRRSEHSSKDELAEDLSTLEQLLKTYRDIKGKQEKAQRVFQETTADKDRMLKALTKLLRKSRKDIQKLDEETSGTIADLMQFRDRHSELPGTPRGLTGRILKRGSFRLKWEKPKRGDGGVITHYEIQMCRCSTKDNSFEILATSDSAATQLELHGLPKDEELRFRIVSKNHLGASNSPSNEYEVIL